MLSLKMSINELVNFVSSAVRKRWDNACYSVACDIEANKHYGDKDSFVFQAKLFIKTFFKIKRITVCQKQIWLFQFLKWLQTR
jgi:hypothetical protein